MALKVPNSTQDCVYFTNRSIGEGNVIAWVYKKKCPKCKKALMGKPVVAGKVKIRAKEYECPDCKYMEDKTTHEKTLVLEAQYTCPSCGKEGESTGEYIRKKFKGVPSFLVECVHCKEKIPLTKKLKGV
ncbi:hypothetical protein HYV86_02035 [Candidatus Woesearchaeota archaeon]|nr:hypothetical protein [Candidatus Woesearchaeota archaeon]